MSETTAQGEELAPNSLILAARRYAQENGAGLVGSALLHGLALILFLLVLSAQSSRTGNAPVRFLPVDLVQLGDKTQSPPAAVKAPVPQARAAPVPVKETTSPTPPEGSAPHKVREAPLDNFAARLNALAHLKQVNVPLPALDNAEGADIDSDSGAPGDRATYAVRDYIRAQVQRRWSVDFSLPGARSMSVLIRLRMKSDGRVLSAEIVDRHRYKTDVAWREVALSARNAVLLSSPFVLPSGHYRPVMDMTLRFDPKDALH
ncbi:MAG TPA: hypothetical protein VGG36_08610 [Rhizomicrobium sp.]|jgi:outer membrane biosynthesis protein TonB